MPRCVVPNCGENGVHRIPKDEKMCKLWLKAIRRENLIVTNSTRLCGKHFLESDYPKVSIYTGVEHQHKYLKKGTVPSIFPWATKPHSDKGKARQKQLKARKNKLTKLLDGISTAATTQSYADTVPYDEDDGVYLIVAQREVESESPRNKQSCGTQTCSNRFITTELLLSNNQTVQFYTGLESPAKFSLVLSTLLPMANNLKYRWGKEIVLSVEDQFLMLLMKLRRNKTHFELSLLFGVSKKDVSNIIVTWINFVSDVWSLLDVWPCQKIVSFYMQKSFKSNYPSSQVSELNASDMQKIESQRAHIERLIGLSKIYLILKNELNRFYVPLASKICSICLMLCNFKEGIVN